MVNLNSQQSAIQLANKERSIIAGQVYFRIIDQASEGIEISEDDVNAQLESKGLRMPTANRKERRRTIASSSAPAVRQSMEWFFGAFMVELNLKVSNLTYASGKTDNEKKKKAIRLLALAIDIFDPEQQLPLPEQKQIEKVIASPNFTNSVVATVFDHTRRLYDKYGQFDGIEDIADKAEKILGRFPVSFMRGVASSDAFHPELDPAFVSYFTKRYEVSFKADPIVTSEITATILDSCSQDPEGTRIAKPLIEVASATLPALYESNHAAAEKLAGKIEAYIDGIKTNDPDSLRNMYRIPALMHSAPLIETGGFFLTASFFDRVFPENGRVDETFRSELAPRLTHINTHVPDLAAKLFMRLSAQPLETHEIVSLRDMGGKLFSRSAERKPENALDYWNAILTLCGDSNAVVTAVEDTIAAAQLRFALDASFARSYLTTVSTKFFSDANLLSNVSGSDLVTGDVDGHFVVVADQNRASILNGGEHPVSGLAPNVLSDVMSQHPEELASVLPLVIFVSNAQNMVSGRKSEKKPAPYREALMGRVRELMRAQS